MAESVAVYVLNEEDGVLVVVGVPVDVVVGAAVLAGVPDGDSPEEGAGVPVASGVHAIAAREMRVTDDKAPLAMVVAGVMEPSFQVTPAVSFTQDCPPPPPPPWILPVTDEHPPPPPEWNPLPPPAPLPIFAHPIPPIRVCVELKFCAPGNFIATVAYARQPCPPICCEVEDENQLTEPALNPAVLMVPLAVRVPTAPAAPLAVRLAPFPPYVPVADDAGVPGRPAAPPFESEHAPPPPPAATARRMPD